jgi:hypothetical protein
LESKERQLLFKIRGNPFSFFAVFGNETKKSFGKVVPLRIPGELSHLILDVFNVVNILNYFFVQMENIFTFLNVFDA